MASWMNKWQRSPRQDRRVLVNGKFVELTEPILPEVKEEQPESALEIVREEVVPNSDTVVPVSSTEAAVEETDVDKEFKISPMPPIPDEVFKIIQNAQTTGEEIVITGARPPVEVLPETVENTSGESVLDGQDGRVEETIEDATNPVVDPELVGEQHSDTPNNPSADIDLPF